MIGCFQSAQSNFPVGLGVSLLLREYSLLRLRLRSELNNKRKEFISDILLGILLTIKACCSRLSNKDIKINQYLYQQKYSFSHKKYKRASLNSQISFDRIEYPSLKLTDAFDHKDVSCLFLKTASIFKLQCYEISIKLINHNRMGKYVSQDRSKVQKASSSESEKGRNAALEKSTNAIIGRLVKKRLAARTKPQKNLQDKVRRCREGLSSSLHEIMKPDQISCSICYEILVGPVLLYCGHFFCLHCLDKAVFRNGQCPLCRHQIGAENYKPSKQLMTLIDKFIPYILKGSDHQTYLKRVKEFQIIERKRMIPKSLKCGDFVDLNVNQTWVSAQIKGIYNTYMTLRYTYKNQPVYLKVDITSRRIATQYTFTKEPPLKPTYFTSEFNYNEPILRYIVEPPTYTVRVPRRSQSTLVVDSIDERRDWDYFEPIRQNNDWLSEDPVLLPIELQGLSQLDENELLLGH